MRPDQFSPLSADDAAYLLAETERWEPDWLLILPYVPESSRAAWLSLLGFFAETLAIPGRVSNPMLGAIRVAWWREAIGEVYGEGAPRKHPVVLSLASTIAERREIRPFLEATLDALEPFLEPGDDTDFDEALVRRVTLYGAIGRALSALINETDTMIGEALSFHALAGIEPDPSAAATAEGPEPITRRFARALAAQPDLASDLSTRAAVFRRKAGSGQPLAAMPFALVHIRKAYARRISHPLWQRFLVFKAVLTGRF